MKRNGRSPRARPAPAGQLAADLAFLGDAGRSPTHRAGCARRLGLSLIALLLLACLGISSTAGGYAALAASLPAPDALATVPLDQSTKIYDRNGGLLFEIYDPNGGRRTVVSPDQIPLVLRQATVAIEDPTFYRNPGVDLRGIARAIYYDWRYQTTAIGGSTITQQLVKNTLLSSEPTLERKLREAVLALEVTQRFSKDRILSMYLNTIYFGNMAYGIQAAVESYFGKEVSQVDLGEASLLAGLPQAPSRYDPCLNADGALERQGTVLDRMQQEGFISEVQAAAAAAEMDRVLRSQEFISRCAAAPQMQAPHFVEYVRAQLEQQFGTEMVYKGGLQVYTTLDPTLQKIVEEEAHRQIAALSGHNVTSAAVVAVNPQTGEILAMLGSVNFHDKSIDGQVNVATSLRQPGSAIKPINYLTAFEKGWTAATPLLDMVTTFPNGGGLAFSPVNYDGREHGLVSVRTALANSLNIPAVRTLSFVGVQNMIATGRRLGITSWDDPSRYGLALTLGGGEVRLVELTGAYAVFANGGRRMPLTPFTRIVDGQGRLLYDRSSVAPIQVMDSRHAYLITDILSDNQARAMEFGLNSPLRTSRPTFAKTGTTNDFKDNWTLGGTTELVVGVWTGNPRNQPMRNVSGIAGAAPIWHNVLERAYREDPLLNAIPPHPFPVPPGMVQMTICNESGLAPTDLCPPSHRHTEIFLSEQAPRQWDNVWVRVAVDRTNGLLANSACPGQVIEERVFERMPPDAFVPYDRVATWANAHGLTQPPAQVSPCTEALPLLAPGLPPPP